MRNYIISNLPNALSIFRGLSGLVIVYLFLFKSPASAMVLFGIAVLSDKLDGWLARKSQNVSVSGSLLDPICDKIFLLTLFTLFMVLEVCPAWFVGLLLSTSLLECFGFSVARSFSNRTSAFKPLRWGTWSTVLHYSWLGVLFGDALSKDTQFPPLLLTTGFILLGILQITVFLQYFFRVQPALSRFLPLRAMTRHKNS